VGPEVSTATFAEAEKLVIAELTPAERVQAAGNWRSSMAPLYERRTGPRKLALEPTNTLAQERAAQAIEDLEYELLAGRLPADLRRLRRSEMVRCPNVMRLAGSHAIGRGFKYLASRAWLTH
jgi:hypothetical protein